MGGVNGDVGGANGNVGGAFRKLLRQCRSLWTYSSLLSEVTFTMRKVLLLLSTFTLISQGHGRKSYTHTEILIININLDSVRFLKKEFE